MILTHHGINSLNKGSGPKMPKGYTRLAVGVFTGVFYIDYNLITNENDVLYTDEVDAVYRMDELNSYSGSSLDVTIFKLFGSSSLSRGVDLIFTNSIWTYRSANNTYGSQYGSISYPAPQELHINQIANVTKVNEYTKTISTASTDSRQVTQLYGGNPFNNLGLDYFSVKRDGIEFRLFVPAVRDADGVKGVMELYSKVFFTGNIT